MRYFFLILPICVLLAVGGAEIYLRVSDTKNYSALNGRWLEPYVGFGNFKDNTSPISPPEAAGYEPHGLIYQWQPKAPVKSILSRAPIAFGKEYPKAAERAPGLKWVVVMGGSAAFGDGSWPRRFPGLLEEELKKKSSDLKVLTAATRSFVTTQERVALELYVLPLRPDAIVFLHGYNDVSQATSMARPGDPYNMGIKYARYENFFFGLFQLLSDHSRLVEHFLSSRVLGGLSESRNEMLGQEKEIFSESNAAVYVDNVRRMARRCEQEKVPCYFLFQPFRDYTDDYGEDTVREGYRKVVEAFRREPLRGTAQFRDLAALYANRPELFMDEVHMSGDGQALLAQTAAGLVNAALAK